MATLREMAEAASRIVIVNPPVTVTTLEETKAALDSNICGPSILSMFDSVFRPEPAKPEQGVSHED